MAEEKKVVTKTVNRTGKSLVKKALVVKAKTGAKQNLDANKIKELNEKAMAKKNGGVKDSFSVEADKTAETKAVVKEDKKYKLTVGVKDMLAAGCHLGHKISKTHPKARVNVYQSRDGIEIFDLTKSFSALEKACNFIYNAKRNGKQIVMLGTKRQAREAVRRIALEAHVPYITDRWLGGTITNWSQIQKNIRKFAQMKDASEKGEYATKSKRELSEINKEITRLEKMVGGLTGLDRIFDILFIVDSGYEKTAIKEAKIKGIKTIALVDTDGNPRKVDFAIPVNDDSVKSVGLVVEEIGKAIKAAGVK